jgi:hypothetical protein
MIAEDEMEEDELEDLEEGQGAHLSPHVKLVNRKVWVVSSSSSGEGRDVVTGPRGEP